MRKITVILILFCLLGISNPILAQNTLTAAGGNASGSGGSASYTIGQVVYVINSSPTYGSVTQGVQQPFEISVVTAIKQAEDISLDCSVYPNPAGDILTLKVENYDKENLSYVIIDSYGKLLESKKVTGREITVSMANLPPNLYLLKIIDNSKVIKTFKIIKK